MSRFAAALLLELAADVALLVWALSPDRQFVVPAAVARLLLMAFLGTQGLKGRSWAQRSFAGVLALTVLMGLVLAAYAPGRGLKTEVEMAAVLIAALYGLMTWLALSGRTSDTSRKVSAAPLG